MAKVDATGNAREEPLVRQHQESGKELGAGECRYERGRRHTMGQMGGGGPKI